MRRRARLDLVLGDLKYCNMQHDTFLMHAVLSFWLLNQARKSAWANEA
jgi:hypothetical protein